MNILIIEDELNHFTLFFRCPKKGLDVTAFEGYGEKLRRLIGTLFLSADDVG